MITEGIIESDYRSHGRLYFPWALQNSINDPVVQAFTLYALQIVDYSKYLLKSKR